VYIAQGGIWTSRLITTPSAGRASIEEQITLSLRQAGACVSHRKGHNGQVESALSAQIRGLNFSSSCRENREFVRAMDNS
jgi:hypothetical protein